MSEITAKDLRKSFGNNEVLRGIDLKVAAGESLAIIGGSGCGKSVLIKCILGLIPPDKGSAEVLGNDTSSTKGRTAAFTDCGMLFQGGALFDDLTVWRNISFSLLQSRAVSEEEARKTAIETLDKVNLSAYTADLYPQELSGGMQKRVGLARAIVRNPKILFFDEPTTGLDPVMSSVINELLSNLVAATSAAAVMITHDMNSVRSVAKSVVMLHRGKVGWRGEVGELQHTADPIVRQFVSGSTVGPLTE